MTSGQAVLLGLAAIAALLIAHAGPVAGSACPPGSQPRDERDGFPDSAAAKAAMCAACRELGEYFAPVCELDEGPHPLPECLPILRTRMGTPRRLAEVQFSRVDHPPPRIARPEFRAMMPAWEEFFEGRSYSPQARDVLEPYKHMGATELFVMECTDCYLDSQGIAYDFGAVYFAPTFGDTMADRLLVPPFRPCVQRLPKLASVVTYWGNAYGHFLLDVLPKLLLLRPFIAADPSWPIAIVDPEYNNAPGVPAMQRPFLREVFGLLGLGAHAVLEGNVSVAYRAAALRAALYDVGTYMGRAAARETVALVRRWADAAVPPPPPPPPGAPRTIVFYSRAEPAPAAARDHPGKRVLGNEAEVLAAVRAAFPLPRWRVERFAGDGQSFAASLATFREAAAIVGPAGSGLLNMIFARNGTAVVELLGTEAHWLQFEYFAAAACGLPYFLVPVPGGRYDDPEWRVPPAHVVDTLHAALGE